MTTTTKTNRDTDGVNTNTVGTCLTGHGSEQTEHDCSRENQTSTLACLRMIVHNYKKKKNSRHIHMHIIIHRMYKDKNDKNLACLVPSFLPSFLPSLLHSLHLLVWVRCTFVCYVRPK